MTRRSAAALLLACTCVLAYQEAHEIDVSAFDKKVKDGSHWLIMFYAPWCAHCKRLKPVFEQIAEHYHRQPEMQVQVGQIDATAHPGLAAPFNVPGYPTLLMLRDGKKMAQFEGPRTFASITQFVDRSVSGEAPPPAASRPKRKPAAPRSRESFADKLTRVGHRLTEMDSLTAGLWVLGTAVAMGVGFVVLLCATTTANR